MRIKKRLQINVAVLVLTALVICLMLFLALYRVNDAMEASNIADEIVRSVFERSTFREDYLRTNSERAKVQWFARHEQVGGLLKSAAEKFTDREDKKTVDEMIRDHESTGKLFSAIVKNRETAGSGAASAALSREIENRLLTQLIMRLYDKTMHAGKLQKAGNELVLTTLRQAGGGIVAILAIILAVAVAGSWIMSRTIADRVQRLHDGAAVIGGGNLDHHLDIQGDDEFVELSEAFNAMTARLRGSYHNLEKEIEERKRAEEKSRETAVELLAANTDLDHSRRAAVNLLEDALDARRQAEEAAAAVRESEERFRGFVTATSDVIYSMSPDWYEMRHLDGKDFIADTSDPSRNWLAKYIHPDDQSHVMATIHDAIRTRSIFQLEHRVIRLDGTLGWTFSRAIPLFDASGEIVEWFGAARDITDRKRAEEALFRAHDELAKQVEERSRELREKEVLLKEVHHRVKNNLQVISSLVGLQADDSQDETVREVLRDVTDRVRSMALVHEKLYQSVDLAHINFADYARSLLNYLWRAHGDAAASVGLTFDMEPVSLPVDTAVPCGLILNELAGNTLKHAFRNRSGGEVTVSLHNGEDARIRLCVSDNGIGLPAGFDLQRTKSLGLRLVQMLAQQVDAGVEVSSEEGTKFEISFKADRLIG